jgi:4-amino-4-deoxy-L-arabinose transferase-like glycosyltransferase
MNALERKRSRLLLAVAVAALFALLGSRGLNEPDEGRYAEIGREMAARGDWLVPHLNGFEHFQKPPLLYWATGLAIRLFGVNEWAARLPSALAALATVIILADLGNILFTRRVGNLAGMILLSSGGFFLLARLLTPDMMLTFWVTAAIACFVKYAYALHGRQWGYLFFVALGCGFLTKGPMALIIPLSAAIAWQVAARRVKDAPALPWFSGLLLTLGISLSWFVALSLWRHDLFEYFWRYELVERFASRAHGRSKPFWYFAPVILVALVPWVFLLPGAGRQVWSRWREGRWPLVSWLLFGWIVPPFLILSLSGSKLPTYILPLLPGLALGLAAYLGQRERPIAWAPRLAGATLIVGVAVAAAMPSLNDRLQQQASVRDLIRPLAAEPALREARFYAVDVRAHGLEFYLQRLVSATREQADVVLPPTPEQQARLLSTEDFEAKELLPAPGAPPVLTLTRKDRAGRDFPSGDWRELGRAGDFVLLQSIAVRHAAP